MCPFLFLFPPCFPFKLSKWKTNPHPPPSPPSVPWRPASQISTADKGGQFEAECSNGPGSPVVLSVIQSVFPWTACLCHRGFNAQQLKLKKAEIQHGSFNRKPAAQSLSLLIQYIWSKLIKKWLSWRDGHWNCTSLYRENNLHTGCRKGKLKNDGG